MEEKEFSLIRSIMNRSLKPDKFGPQERVDFALGINAMWGLMLEHGSDDQKEFFKKRFTKFCRMYNLPVPDFPEELDEDGTVSIASSIMQDGEHDAEEKRTD